MRRKQHEHSTTSGKHVSAQSTCRRNWWLRRSRSGGSDSLRCTPDRAKAKAAKQILGKPAMFAVFDMETGDFCSESPVLTAEAKRNGQRATGNGQRWNNTGILPVFACRYA